ncbi:MAG: hypothetical protein PHD68_09470 [Rugosibacter sp.]|nr:hypothetical protein [Rugosibacter sp.]
MRIFEADKKIDRGVVALVTPFTLSNRHQKSSLVVQQVGVLKVGAGNTATRP